MAGFVPPTATVGAAKVAEVPKAPEHVDYKNLPCPIPYEENHREAMSQYAYP